MKKYKTIKILLRDTVELEDIDIKLIKRVLNAINPQSVELVQTEYEYEYNGRDHKESEILNSKG